MTTENSSLGIVQVASAALLTVLLGYLVIVGKTLLLPILVGVISAYILITAADRLGELPVLGALPIGIRRLLAGLFFLAVVIAFVVIVASNAQAISDAVPRYTENLTALVDHVSDMLGIADKPDIATIFAKMQSWFNVEAMVNSMLGGLTAFGTFLFSALLYAAFLMADWGELPAKTERAFGKGQNADRVIQTARAINQRIGTYLASKTLINLILGAVSLAVMWVLGIEFAFFWAVLIALLNYIPYIGSIVGVMFPVAIALAQFGTIYNPLIAFAALMGAQIYVGNYLEPKMVGKSVNMSAFVFLIALSFWMTIWGLEGAILAIPLTSMIMIVLAEIPQTRPIAAMMSADGDV